MIAEDVFNNQTLVVKKGTKVTPKIKQALTKFNVKKVAIFQKKNDDSDKSQADKETISTLFYEVIKEIVDESRYGKVFKDDASISLMHDLFLTIVQEEQVYKKLVELKNYNPYSFYHSIDVFILSSLLAKECGINDVEIFKGFLLHDIGKLDVPEKILNKEGKLTQEEYELIKDHTTKGEKWLKEHSFSKVVQQLARSHHERLDGLGYPDQKNKDFSLELKILIIVDVYSALSLGRSYRKKLSAVEALETMLREGSKLPKDLLFSLMNLLLIYPPQSIIRLTNGNKAKVLHVFEPKPYIPLVFDYKTNKSFELPRNLTLMPKEIIEWDSTQSKKRKKDYWNNYLDSLIKGEKKQAMNLLDILSDNMRVEDIYMDIIAKSLREIGDLWEEGEISIAQEHIASSVTKEIMDSKIKSYRTVSKNRGRILLFPVKGENHKLPLKILADTLEVNGWFVYNLLDPLPEKDVVDFMEKENIEIVGISCILKDNIENLKNTVEYIKLKKPSSKIIVGGPATKDVQLKDVEFTALDAKNALKKLERYRDP